MQTLINIYTRTKGIFLFSVFLFPSLLLAQEQDSAMVQSVRLERDYSPVVQQKSKIDRQPALQEVQKGKSDASYIDWQVDAVRSSEIGVVPAGEVIATDPADASLGYLELSAGNFWNTDLRAGLRMGDFAVDAKGFYTQSRLKLPHSLYFPESDSIGSGRWHNRLLSGDVTGTYSVTLANDAQFDAHLGLAGTSVRTFNYQFYGQSTDTLVRTADEAGLQSFGRIFGDVGYETDAFRLRLSYDFNKLSVSDSLPTDWRTNTLMLSGTYGIYDNDRWQASLDLDLGGVFGRTSNYFILHPTLHVSVMPDALAWRRFYADLGFGRRRQSLYDVMSQLPIACFDEEYKPSADCIALRLGYEDNDQGYLRWGVAAELEYVEDELCAEAVPVDTTSRDGLYMRIMQDDCFAFGLEGHVDYEYSRYFGLKADLHLHTHSCEAAGMGDPHLRMALHALSNPGKVHMDLGLDFGFMREVQYIGHSYSLGSIADLNYRLDWQCRDNLSVFAFARNILNHRYELWPGVPAQGINLHAGFRWEF